MLSPLSDKLKTHAKMSFLLSLDAEALKKKFQVRIVGQERDNAIIVFWNDVSPANTVSILENILKSDLCAH